MKEIHFNSSQHEYFIMRVLSRQYPNSKEYYDVNWLNSEIEIKINCLQGLVKGTLFAADFPLFKNQLIKLNQTLKGVANFSTMEHWINFTLSCDNVGHVYIEGKLYNSSDVTQTSSNYLQFSFNLDQTFLPKMIQEISFLIDEFSVVN